MSGETSQSRVLLAPFCRGLGLDMGFGGDAIVPSALTFDLAKPHAGTGEDKQILRGDCRDLSFICDEALDYIYSSHLLEDFSYCDLADILKEWRRVLKPGGRLILNCPDQQRYLAHCAKTGQPLNLAHVEPDFSIRRFQEVLPGDWRIFYENESFGNYSWLLVLEKSS